jgi:hypothetical protein
MKKYGKKLILSDVDEIPRGLFDPSKCTADMCTSTIPTIANGKR